MKLLVLIEVGETPTERTLVRLTECIHDRLHGHTIQRIDVEGIDGMTREGILVDVLGEAQTENEQEELGRRLGAALARQDRSKRR